MKKNILLLALFLVNFTAWAKQVPLEKAKEVAENFIKSVPQFNNTRMGSIEINLVYQAVSAAYSPVAKSTPATFFYVFNVGDNNGMVIISGDDKVIPVLGYTDQGSFNEKDLPPHFVKWLENYKTEIRFAIDNLQENESTTALWASITDGDQHQKSNLRTKVSGPLMTTKWNQSPYYNDLCPYDEKTRSNSVSGCVATAMAQIMKYWSYPETGSGFHSYNHPQFGTLSANFSETSYNWASMPDEVYSSNPAVATLMYHLGVSVDMNYSGNSSGAYVIADASPVQHNSEYALKTYFGYNDVQGVQRENYSLSNWIDLLKSELDAGQPVLYAGFGGGGGHAFVCDGYTNDNFFHINWGWGGYYDGNFAITALNPEDVGTGGGTGGFNSGHQAVIGIKPPAQDINYELELYENLTSDYSTIGYGLGFTIHTDVINNSNGNFNGDFCAAAFDEDGNFVDFIATLTDYSLPVGYHFIDGLDFTTEGLLTLLPGNYTIYTFYKPVDGNWMLLKSGNKNFSVEINVMNSNDLELYGAIEVEQGDELINGEAISVTLDVANFGTDEFKGILDVSLYHLDGSFAFTVEEKEDVSICADCHFQNGLTFENSRLEIDPGTYLLAVLHKKEGMEYEITGSSYYTNPVKVIVKEAAIQPDSYEENDEIASSHNLVANFNGNTSSIKTTGSNIHSESDYDYFKLELPSGYMYSLKARVLDLYNTGESYTNDVLFSYSTDGQSWSDAFDDQMPSALQIEGGGEVYFLVSSYFQGETGSYLLDITTTRSPVTSNNDFPEKLNTINVYPNPSAGIFHIQNDSDIKDVQVVDLSGRIMYKSANLSETIDLTSLEDGIYILKLFSDNGFTSKKIIKK